MQTLSSPALPELIMTTLSAAGDGKVGTMKTLVFQWRMSNKIYLGLVCFGLDVKTFVADSSHGLAHSLQGCITVTAPLPVWWRHQMETFSALLALSEGNHRSPVNSPHKGQWRGALMFSLIRAWINGWTNNQDAGDLSRHFTHYDVTAMSEETMKNMGKFTRNCEPCASFSESTVTAMVTDVIIANV